ncbi:MAG: hypothetical protein Hyperionvirus2_25 [Hyperionvirus sp.]|uniref:Uncharacterized protein n=1 Tax=Hyperionvirus sp. TaxID=2487770 RepID=A0A3G5A600_9VIRU|nr:MAG: hypothetical protein Hyperionvirus2_25 [Hyperionvirus sp.]
MVIQEVIAIRDVKKNCIVIAMRWNIAWISHVVSG